MLESQTPGGSNPLTDVCLRHFYCEEQMTGERCEDWFAYHKPTQEQIDLMQEWRVKAAALANDFCQNSPMGPDRTYALRKLKETLMAMNAALVSPMPRVPY